jgi:DNA-binding HxlR family transcriptional regulator
MAVFDLLGRRWALRLLWELRDESLTFRELQGRCDDMSSSVLNQRLRDLRSADIVALDQGGGYRLTDEGLALVHALVPLHQWAADWSKRV